MNDRRTAGVVRGVLSLVAILALLVGVPLLLVLWVGWPLPTSLPSLDALEQVARSGLSDQVVVKTLAVIAWIAWSQLALALVVETVAVARGRQAIRVPVLPGFQVIAARLVAGILMIASTVQPARAHAAPPPLSVVAEATTDPAALIGDRFVPGFDGDVPTLIAQTSSSTAAPPAVERPTVTVQRHDSYWAIAERTLGDGLRWKEILDLNVGRMLPGGTTITASDDTLYAGWVLVLPADATGDGTTPTAPPQPAQMHERAGLSTFTVEHGDNLWTIAEDRLEVDLAREPTDPEVVPYWHEVIDANQDRYVQPGNPNLILPGQVLVLPPTGHEPPAPSPAEAEPSPPTEDVAESAASSPLPPAPEEDDQPAEASVTSTTIAAPIESEAPPRPVEERSPTDAEDDDTEDDVTRDVAVAVAGLSSIALAVGLKRLLARRRRRYANEHDGQVPGRTPLEQRGLHQAVVAQADEERIADLQGVLGSLAAALAGRSSARRPRMLRHSADSLEVLLDQPDTDAPPGWTSTDDGTVWTLHAPPDPDDPYDGPLSPAPLLVTVGQPEDDAQLYLDLEAHGLLALTGDPDVATNLARSIVTELTLSPLAETLRVIAVGDVVDQEAKVLEHLTVVHSWDGITEDLLAWAGQSHEALAENDWPNAFVARGHEPDHDALVPVAVVADRPPPPELTEALRASLHSTVAVVVVGAFDGAVATIRCEADALNFDAIDLACAPQEVQADELAEMCRLLVATDSPDEHQLIDELQTEHEMAVSSNGSGPIACREHAVDDEHSAPEPNEPPTYDVLVRLLGDITVEGGKPLKPKATSVVAYLALHRSVSTERLEEACWFGSDGTSHRKRLRDVMTESRDALGSQHLPANRSGTYVAGPRVGTDIELFEWHVQRAAVLEPSEAIEQYRAALDLVTGKPFSYPNAARASYGWVDFEHHSTEWEYRVARIAQACAEIHVDSGEPGEAIAMLRRVVQAIPLNSGLVEALMRAHVANDDRAGAEHVYLEHAAALEQAKLGDPDDVISQLRLELRSASAGSGR